MKNINKKNIYGLAKKRAKLKIMKVSSAQIEAFERDYWIRYNRAWQVSVMNEHLNWVTNKIHITNSGSTPLTSTN